MRVSFLIGALALLGCAPSASSGSDTTAIAVANMKPAVPPPAAAPSPSDTSPALRLVGEYVRRDAAGERLQNSTWFNGVLTEIDEDPGYDSFTAIRSYQILPGDSNGDTTRVSVRYAVVGSMQQISDGERTTGIKVVPHDTTEVVVFPVVHTAKGLKIVSPQIDQHVSAAAILANTSLPPLDAGSRTRLRGVGGA
jgi:hypothetical protein